MCIVCMRMSTGKYIIPLLIIFHPGHVWMFHKISSANKEKILWIRKNNYIIFWLWNVYYYNILSGKNKYYAEEIYIHNISDVTGKPLMSYTFISLHMIFLNLVKLLQCNTCLTLL
jgi:hypothetical protein